MSVKKDGGEEEDHHHHHHDHHHKLYRGFFAWLLAFVVLVLFTILVIYLVLRPTKPRFLLQDASVVALNLSGTPPAAAAFLTTTMQVTLATRNPNDRIGVYYDKLDVYAAYKYQQVTLATAIPPTYQGHNDAVVWSPFLYGVSVPLAPYLALAVAQDQSAGVMLLHVRARGKLRWKVGTWTSGHYHISVSCPALLAFGGANKGGGGGAYLPVIRFQQGSTCTVDV